jgi:predicted DNA-binding protein (UPF0278 family)
MANGRASGYVRRLDQWQNLRAATGVPYTQKGSTTYTENIQSAVKGHFEKMNENGQLRQGLLNPVDDLRMLPFCIVVGILSGDMTLEQRSKLLGLTYLREMLFKRMI